MDILANIINYIVNPLIYLIVGLAVIYFLWGVLTFIRNAESSEKRVEGARHVMWGIIGIAIMVCVFTFVHILENTIGPNSYQPYVIGK